MIELKSCPKCGLTPLLGYACGEFFIVGNIDCPMCWEFNEMHTSKEQEVEAWNGRVGNG